MPEVMMVQTPIALHNLHGPDANVEHRHLTMTAFLNACAKGIGGFNEFNSKDAAWFNAQAAQRGLRLYRYGQDGVVWDPKVFSLNGKPRVRKIMQGGHVGADGVAHQGDDRRVGPSRFGIYVPLTVIAIGLEWEFCVTHPMARAFTSSKWRLPLFWRSIKTLADAILSPDGIMVGDMNDPKALDLPGVADVAVPVPATMGHMHYDQILRWGAHIYVSATKVVNTPSDHHMVKGLITFYKNAQAHLVAPPDSPTPTRPSVNPLPKPGTAGVNWRRYGSPVAHPWAKQYTTVRFKRRRPVQYRRIDRWKAAYRRRL